MDAYHLLYAMVRDKIDKTEFKRKSLFIDNNDGLLDMIRVQVNSPITIKKLKNGQIKISAYSYYDGC